MADRDNYTNALTKTGVALESTYGTAASTFKWLNIQSNGIKQTNVFERGRAQHNSREPLSNDLTQKLYRGPINWKVQDGTMLLAAFGSLSTTGASTPYTHEFTTGDTLKPVTVYKQITGRGTLSGIFERFIGGKVNKLTLECSEKGFLMATSDMWFSDKDSTSEKSITSSTVTPFRFADISKGEVDVNSGTKVKLISYKYERDNKLSEEQEGETIAEPQAQELEETLTSTVKMSGTDLKTLQENGTEFPFVIKFERGTDDYIELTHTVKISGGADPETAVTGAVETEVTFQVLKTSVEVKDSNATYEI